jgi:hypothetical protein
MAQKSRVDPLSIKELNELLDAQIERATEKLKFARSKASKDGADYTRYFFESIKHHLNNPHG